MGPTVTSITGQRGNPSSREGGRDLVLLLQSQGDRGKERLCRRELVLCRITSMVPDCSVPDLCCYQIDAV